MAGDYDDSGSVEQADLDLVLTNWGFDTADPLTGGVPQAWKTGLPDGPVDQAELDAVLSNWGSILAPDFRGVVVPEPAISFAGVMLATFFKRTRGKSE